MNSEKIRELAKQSGFYFYDLHDIDGQDLGETIESDSWDSADKFAELIIRECVSICKEKERPNLYSVREVENTIKEHFGIEE